MDGVKRQNHIHSFPYSFIHKYNTTVMGTADNQPGRGRKPEKDIKTENEK